MRVALLLLAAACFAEEPPAHLTVSAEVEVLRAENVRLKAQLAEMELVFVKQIGVCQLADVMRSRLKRMEAFDAEELAKQKVAAKAKSEQPAAQ